jgi:hypothetical protein
VHNCSGYWITIFWTVGVYSVLSYSAYSSKLKIKLTLFLIKHVKQANKIWCSGMRIIMFEVCGARINQSEVNEV